MKIPFLFILLLIVSTLNAQQETTTLFEAENAILTSPIKVKDGDGYFLIEAMRLNKGSNAIKVVPYPSELENLNIDEFEKLTTDSDIS